MSSSGSSVGDADDLVSTNAKNALTLSLHGGHRSIFNG